VSAELTFPSILWLLPVIAVLTCVCYLWKRNSYIALALRIISLSAFILALAEPLQKKITTTNKAVAIFDVSTSVPSQAKTEMANKIIEYAKSNNSKIETYAFAASASEDSTTIDANTTTQQALSAIERTAVKLKNNKSNIYKSLEQVALQTGAGSILLLSDGNEEQQVESISKNFSVFPVIINDALFLKKDLSIADLSAPTTIKSGDKAKLKVVVRNNSDIEQSETITLALDGEEFRTKQVTVAPNSQKLVTVNTNEIKGGKHKVTASLSKSKQVVHSWVTAHEKSKTLLLSGETEDERVLSTLIRLKGYKLESIIAGSQAFPEDLTPYSTIIFNNIAKAQLPRDFLEKIKSYANQGGGVLLLGGNRSYGLGGYIDSQLEQISPLKFTPPQAEKRRLINAIALVMDKSGSMAEQNKIVSAKKAALSSIESLKDEDYITVIGFDFAPFVIIDLQKIAIVKQTAEARLRNLTAVGKTNLLPALAAARQKLSNSPASRKHIIVLSDGKFPLESDLYVDEINKLRQNGVTVSAVALGSEADVPFMKLLARYGKGAFYQAIDGSSLPEIFVEDIKVSTQENSLNEQMNFPIAIGPAGILSTTIEKYRPLRGFVETLPKSGSSLELITKNKNQAFPILASWQYGKGNVIAFTSDANGRWSGPWLSWDKFSVFWGELLQKLQPKENQQKDVEFDLRYKVQGNKLKLDLAIYGQDQSVSGVVNNLKQNINFTPAAKGKYYAELELKKEDDYFFDINVGQTKLPEIGINVNMIGEISGNGINLEYLLNLAKLSGGEVNPEKIASRQLVNTDAKHLHLPLIIFGFFIVLFEAFIRESRTTKN
jgi:Ca-activated chloride channel family protein